MLLLAPNNSHISEGQIHVRHQRAGQSDRGVATVVRRVRRGVRNDQCLGHAFFLKSTSINRRREERSDVAIQKFPLNQCAGLLPTTAVGLVAKGNGARNDGNDAFLEAP